MMKIPCLFERDFTDPRRPVLLEKVTPGCEWVVGGGGVATLKRDGTATMVRERRLYKRYDAKRGKQPPPGFIAAQEPDPVTGHHPGWVEVDYRNPAPDDVYIALAYWHARASAHQQTLPDGTYEAVGPRINGNRERLQHYTLVRHGSELFPNVPRTFAGLREFLTEHNIEGLVFWRNIRHFEQGACKIRRADFGLEWPAQVVP